MPKESPAKLAQSIPLGLLGFRPPARLPVALVPLLFVLVLVLQVLFIVIQQDVVEEDGNEVQWSVGLFAHVKALRFLKSSHVNVSLRAVVPATEGETTWTNSLFLYFP